MKSIQDIMIKNPITITDTATVQDAIDLFSAHHIGCLPVVDMNGALVAFLSNGDVINFLARRTRQQDRMPLIFHATTYDADDFKRDEEILSESKELAVTYSATRRVQYAYVDDNLAEVASVMDNRHLKHMPILERDSGKLVGLLARRSLMLALFDEIAEHIS
ncbi:MAG: CBS domain-containing protein [Peptococcaceae bacterium]|nr:CBS domain-containing protein [Peptococcaceae bacterium]